VMTIRFLISAILLSCIQGFPFGSQKYAFSRRLSWIETREGHADSLALGGCMGQCLQATKINMRPVNDTQTESTHMNCLITEQCACDVCLEECRCGNADTSSECHHCCCGSPGPTPPPSPPPPPPPPPPPKCECCSAGSFYDATQNNCPCCPAGTFTDHCNVNDTCNPCPEGHYCPLQTTTPVICKAGTYCDIGSQTETPCYPGSYSDTQGASFCQQCPAGDYCPSGSKQPTPCDAGTYSNKQGAGNASTCQQCPAGDYCPSGSKQPVPNAIGVAWSSTPTGILVIVLSVVFGLATFVFVGFRMHRRRVLRPLVYQNFDGAAPRRLAPVLQVPQATREQMTVFVSKLDDQCRRFVQSTWAASNGNILHIELNPFVCTTALAESPVLQKFWPAYVASRLSQIDGSNFYWHGTRMPSIEPICRDGFNPALRSGQALGPGEYFGRNSTVSHPFAHPDPQGRRHMLAVFILPGHGRSHNDVLIVDNPRQGQSFCLPVSVVYYGLPVVPANYRHISTFQGDRRVLYHETSALAAQSILQNNFNVALSSVGMCGRGVYFATHPRSCHQKTRNKGVIVRAIVNLGRILEVSHQGRSDLNLLYLRSQGYMSVRIPRNDFNKAITENGAEYVVYDVSQISNISLISGPEYNAVSSLP
jgi:hypothetical protein